MQLQLTLKLVCFMSQHAVMSRIYNKVRYNCIGFSKIYSTYLCLVDARRQQTYMSWVFYLSRNLCTGRPPIVVMIPETA